MKKLNQNEIAGVSGGLLAEVAVMTLLVAGYSTLKTWQNGSCDAWSRGSKAQCYAVNVGEDAAFYGVLLTVVAAKFAATKVKTA